MDINDNYSLPIAVRGIANRHQRHIERKEGHTLYQITLITEGEGVYINEVLRNK